MRIKQLIFSLVVMILCSASSAYAQNVAKVGDTEYEKLSAAITAATAGQTITLVADVNESVTISKSLTIDGAGKTFKGKMEISVKSGAVSVKNVNFNGDNDAYQYALKTTGTTATLTVENCTVKDYSFGFLHLNKSTTNATVKNVTVENVNYGVHSVYGTNLTLENYNAINTANAVYVQNYGIRNVVLNNCTFDGCKNPLAIWEKTQTNKITFNFKGVNDMGKEEFCTSAMAIIKAGAQVGTKVYETLDAAFVAAEDGDEVKVLTAGTYSLSTSGKNITITGAVDGVVFDNIGAKNMGSANVTFNNVTFDYYPNANYTGLQHSGRLVYNKCTIDGQVFLYGESETFNNCTFNQNSADAYNVWTYGAKEVYFNECTFNCVGKSVLVYTESKTATNDVAVTKCVFSASAPVEGKAAIEIDTSLSAGATITVDGETTATGFDNGSVSGNSLWNNKKGNADVANNDVTVVVNGDTVLAPIPDVAKIGETGYRTLAEAIAAIGAGDVVIELLNDATLDYGAREAFGTAETTSVTINGNGKTLTLNQTNSDWSSFGLAAGKVAFNNVVIEKTGYGDTSGAWNTHAIIFSSPVEMTGVTVNNGIAVQAGATLTNVTINEANGFYGLWVNGNGQAVTVNGGAINATNGGRGIKVADQYIATPAQVTLNVTGTKFSTAKKAAVLVSSTAGAKITANNVDITEVAEDNVNFVWVDEDWAQYFANVEVTGATVAQESVESFAATINNSAYFKSLSAAITAATAGQTITLVADVNESVTINKSLTIDGAGKQYTGTMTGNAGITITVQNVNFVNGGFAKTTKNSTGNYTIKNCTFDGAGRTYTYPLLFKGASKVAVENCTVKDYLYSFLYITSGTNAVSVKNVTVEDCPSYAVYFASGVNNATFEGLTVKNSNNGFVINNSADRSFTIKDCKMENVATAIAEANGTKTITCTALGVNDFGTAEMSQYVKFKAQAQAGALVGDFAGVVEAAEADATVALLADATGAGAVINKNITIDFGGKAYTFNKGVGSTGTESNGFQILKGNTVTLKNGTLNVDESAKSEFYTIIQNYANLTVEDMTLDGTNLDKWALTDGDSYVLSINSGDVAINGNTNITANNDGEKAFAFDACTSGSYAAPVVKVYTTGTITGKIENSATIEIYSGTYTMDVTEWCADGYFCQNNGDGTYGISSLKGMVAKVGDVYYNSLTKAIEAAEAGATVEILADITLEGGYEDTTEGLRIEKEITIEGNGYTIDCGNFEKGVRIYNPTNAGDFNVSINNVTIVNALAKGRCIDTRSGNINLKVNGSNLIATNTNSQPLTIGGTKPVHRITLAGTNIDAGKSGYAVISFVSTNVDINTSGHCDIKGYAAFYLKGDAITTKLNIGQGTYTATNDFAEASGVFGAVVLEGSDNVVNFLGTNAVIKAVANNTAPQAAFLIMGANNTVKITNESAKVITEGNAYFAMVNAENAETVTINDNGTDLIPVAECNGYQFLSLTDAVRFANNDDVITLVNDITMDTKNLVAECDGYSSFVHVQGKAITIDLNGKAIVANAYAEDLAGVKGKMLLGVFSTDEAGKLTLVDSKGTATVTLNANDATVYSLLCSYNAGCNITVEGGTYVADKVSDSMIYGGGSDGQTDIVVINGGNFTLGNVGEGANGKPWIFNVLGANDRRLIVNGGTFNADVNHQYWAHEVFVPETKALENNGDGTWTVVPAVAYAIETSDKRNRNVGYATVTEAIMAKTSEVHILAGEVSEYIAPWAGDSKHTSEKSITIVGAENFGTTLTGGMYLGYDDSQCREHNIVVKGIVFTGKGLKVACQQNVTIEDNKFIDITEGRAIAVIGKDINSIVKNNVIENVTSAQGIELRNTLTAVVEGNTITGTSHNSLQITSQVGATESSAIVTDNTLSNWGMGGEGRAMRINGIVTATINGNVMSHTAAPEEFVKVTGSTTLNVAENYWGGNSPITSGIYLGVAANPVTELISYYTDAEMTNLVELYLDELTIVDGDYDEFINQNVKTVGTLTYERTLNANNIWLPLFVPFEIPVAYLNERGYEVATFYDVHFDIQEGGIVDLSSKPEIHLIKINSGTLKANYPYVIRANTGADLNLVIELEDAKLHKTDKDSQHVIESSTTTTRFEFAGTYVRATRSQLTGDDNVPFYALNTKGEISKVASSTARLGAFRVYMTIWSKDGSPVVVNNEAAKTIMMSVIGEENEDGTTTIYDVFEVTGNNGMIFDLQGRRVLEPQKGSIYIIDGKKVIY